MKQLGVKRSWSGCFFVEISRTNLIGFANSFFLSEEKLKFFSFRVGKSVSKKEVQKGCCFKFYLKFFKNLVLFNFLIWKK